MTSPRDRLEILKQIKSKTIRVPGGKIIYAPEPSCYQWLIAELEQAWARLDILSRYHGGDGSITREQVIEVLASSALGEE